MTTLSRLKKNLGPVGTTTFRGYLAEDYDGIGQYILITLSRGSTSGALKARIAAGDFNSGAIFPRGTPVVIFSDHGQLEVLSLGSTQRTQIMTENTSPDFVEEVGCTWANPIILGVTAGTHSYGAATAMDGTKIVGVDQASVNGLRAVLWDADNPTAVPTLLGFISSPSNQNWSMAQCVHGDYIVGEANFTGLGYSRAVVWDANNPTAAGVVLGYISAEVSSGANWVDGINIVGSAQDATTSYAVMWDATNPTAAPTILGGAGGTNFRALCIVGNYIVGSGVISGVLQGLLWDAANPSNAPINLGAIPGQSGSIGGAVHGNRIVGGSTFNPGNTGAMWDATNPTGTPDKFTLPSGYDTGYANGVYGDLVVGFAEETGFGPDHAMAWDALSPTTAGVVLGSVPNQDYAYAYSAYGTTIVGEAITTTDDLPVIWLC